MRHSPIRTKFRMQPALRRGRAANRVAIAMLLTLASVLVFSVAAGVYRLVRI